MQIKKAGQTPADSLQKPARQVPVEKKMRLAQYIRAENMDNRMKVRQRERILYGVENTPPLWEKGALRGNEYIRTGEGAEGEAAPVSGTFKLRMAAAVLLFVGFLLCDAGGYKIWGYSMNDIYGMISKDYFKLNDADTDEQLSFSELFEMTGSLDFKK